MRSFFALTLILFCFSCQTKQQSSTRQSFLFLGHTYNWQDFDRLDPRLEHINYENFDGILLGGDLLARTLRNPDNLPYLDQYFHLDDPNTHWARGNHDEMESDSLQWLDQATGRPEYYFHQMGKLGFLVLNTNLLYRYSWSIFAERCGESQKQFDLIQGLADTLPDISHLLILHHQTFPIVGNEEIRKKYNVIPPETLFTCDTTSTYLDRVYPLLEKIKNNGVQLVFLGGDLGVRAKSLEYKSEDGFVWLGVGLNNTVGKENPPDYVLNFNPDSLLILDYHIQQENLDWSFKSVNDLLKGQLGDKYESLPAQVKAID